MYEITETIDGETRGVWLVDHPVRWVSRNTRLTMPLIVMSRVEAELAVNTMNQRIDTERFGYREVALTAVDS